MFLQLNNYYTIHNFQTLSFGYVSGYILKNIKIKITLLVICLFFFFLKYFFIQQSEKNYNLIVDQKVFSDDLLAKNSSSIFKSYLNVRINSKSIS